MIYGTALVQSFYSLGCVNPVSVITQLLNHNTWQSLHSSCLRGGIIWSRAGPQFGDAAVRFGAWSSDLQSRFGCKSMVQIRLKLKCQDMELSFVNNGGWAVSKLRHIVLHCIFHFVMSRLFYRLWGPDFRYLFRGHGRLPRSSVTEFSLGPSILTSSKFLGF